MLRMLLALGAFLFAVPASAFTLQLSGSTVVGVNGLEANGAFYDVVFTEGSCASLFSGCNEDADLPPYSGPISTALLDALNSTLPSDIFGCGPTESCLILIPYDWGPVQITSTYTLIATDPADSRTGLTVIDPFLDTTGPDGLVFALFSPAAPVPEPGTWAMMLLGFGAVGVAMRRRKRVTPVLTRTA